MGGEEIFFTQDEGRDWQAQFKFEQARFKFYGIQFLNSDIGWAIGSGGHFFKTADSGKSWDIECTFVAGKDTHQAVIGKKWHSFINWLVNVFERQKSSLNKWMISAVNGSELKIWVAGERGVIYLSGRRECCNSRYFTAEINSNIAYCGLWGNFILVKAS